MREKSLQDQIFLRLGSRPDVRLFRNNVGNGFFGKVEFSEQSPSGLIVTLSSARRVQVGLCTGSSDIIGLRRVEITPDMVGQVIGQFVAIECKTRTGRSTDEQKKFLECVRKFGGLAIEARDVPEL